MSLQRRLTLYFVLIVMLPLVAAAFGVQQVVGSELERRAVGSLGPALDAGITAYNGRVEVLEPEVRSSVGSADFAKLMASGERAELTTHLNSVLSSTKSLDVIVVLNEDGILAKAARPAAFVAGYQVPRAEEIVDSPERRGAGFVRTEPIPIHIAGEGHVADVVGATWIDRNILKQPAQEDVHLSLAIGNSIVASTSSVNGVVNVPVETDERFSAELEEPSIAEAEALGGDMSLVASTPSAPLASVSRRLLFPMLGVLLLALFVTSALALLLARHLTQPLEELAAGAAALSEGRFDHEIAVRSKDEVGRLAIAFNEMRDRLATTYTQLSSSRDQLQRAVRRVGETLRSTHDMNQMLGSILNTAADAVDADAATLWRFTPTRDGLHASLSVGLDGETKGGPVPVGEGIVGFVAERAKPVLLPSSGGPPPSRKEPYFPATIAVPIYSEDRITAVLATYRNDQDRLFSKEDLETVVFLAEQGGVAIENVLLHEEAQRLSLTDGLTGTWNRRYFQMQFRQVLATAARFNRPFSLLMLDLDHFKKLNDSFGHQRGDAILIEFSRRVKETLREVDTLARYGGEEFIVLLPETDEEGARTTGEKIREAIRAQPFGSLGDEPVPVTVSVGVASNPRDGDTFDTLVEAADRALYAAKQAGRDRVMVADPPGPNLKVAK